MKIQNVLRNESGTVPIQTDIEILQHHPVEYKRERKISFERSFKLIRKRCQEIERNTTKMKDEVRSAIKFLTEVLSRNSKVNQEQIQTFKDTLEELIIARFENHWHPNKPLKGNAFRCINIEMTGIDPVLLKATKASGISPSVLLEIFPGGLALWIDPGEVSCRIGKGSICPLYCNSPQQQQQQQQQSSNRPQKPLQPVYFNSTYSQCSRLSFQQTLFPRIQNNKENFDRYHWVSKDYSKRPTEVF